MALTIRCDDPVLRPGSPRRIRAVASRTVGASVTHEPLTFEVTFRYGAVWDVARIARPLELRTAQSPQPAEFDLAS